MNNKNKYLSIRRDINIVNWLGLYTLYIKVYIKFIRYSNFLYR